MSRQVALGMGALGVVLLTVAMVVMIATGEYRSLTPWFIVASLAYSTYFYFARAGRNRTPDPEGPEGGQ